MLKLTCNPIDSYEEVFNFLDNPPVWASLCKDIVIHSEYAIRNLDIDENIEESQTFCHILNSDFDFQRHRQSKLSKTLICHDMANGYHDDSVVDGTGRFDAYNFYNWAGVDIFCYFSHHFITIPPLSWINVGHEHGVKVIGTVITEWEDGFKLWVNILKSETEWRKFADALVAIANILNFDGWLLNIENKITEPQNLLSFVRYLHQQLHRQVRGAVLIWYDSVTIEGNLHWQNGLNERNKDFFDATDGIFTNYSWTEANVAESAAMAGPRVRDVYVGLDVWGRNFYGGGKFNTVKAARIAHMHDCSIAIFAPAWRHEAIPSTKDNSEANIIISDSLNKYDNFLLRDRALWGSLWPYLNTKLPSRLPFKTSFCRGQGKKRWVYGEVFCPVPWYNLRHMQYQPSSAHGPHGYLISPKHHIERYQRIANIFDAKNTGAYRNILDYNFVLYQKSLLSLENDDALEKKDLQNDQPSTFSEETSNTLEETPLERTKRGSEISSSSTSSSPKEKELDLISFPWELQCLELYQDDAYLGGSCIKINPSDERSTHHRTSRLFFTDFAFDEALIICVVTKTLSENREQYLNILLEISNSSDENTSVMLAGTAASADVGGSNEDMVYITPVDGGRFKETEKYLRLNEPNFYIPVENKYNWEVRYYVVEVSPEGGRVLSVRCRTGLPRGGILLGHFGICHKKTVTTL